MMYHLRLASLISFLLFYHISHAQNDSFSLSGSVKEQSTEETLPNATVLIESSGQGTVTNQDGYFTLLNVPNDTATLLIRYVGYQSQRIKLTPETARQPLTIYLAEAASELSEVVVTAPGSGQMMRASQNISQISISPAQMAGLPSLGEKDIFR
ncbi:MAG: carboxypeptidase-like regulatory domain-containing protein, partial [Bacteroidota bacterium]